MKFFNITGPCNPTAHYMLPFSKRFDMRIMERLIAQESYFVLHAPRQTGKSTSMLELAKRLTESGDYTSVMVSMETKVAFPDDLGMVEDAILERWKDHICLELPEELQPSLWKTDAPTGVRISSFLTEWSLESSRPLIVLIDEIDALKEHVLLSVLAQLRDGFSRRPTAFPSSIGLIGLRDVQNHRSQLDSSSHLVSSVPFNIVARSFTLYNFTQEEIYALLRQHTAETGQVFTDGALAQVLTLSQGQPWLVNALAKVSVEQLVSDATVEVEHINEAKEILMQRRQTYLDQSMDKLHDEHVMASPKSTNMKTEPAATPSRTITVIRA